MATAQRDQYGFPVDTGEVRVQGSRTGSDDGIVRFLWTLTLFLVIVALLPGRVGLAVGALVALGAVLLAPRLPELVSTVVRGGA